MSAWLIKSEPSVYPFSRLVSDKKTVWDGVRNFEARNNLRKMKKGDVCLFYHSNEGKAVVGIAKVVKEAYPDPTGEDGEDWSVVEVGAVKPLAAPVTLEWIKAHPKLSDMALVRRSRLSVTPVTDDELRVILSEGKTKL